MALPVEAAPFYDKACPASATTLSGILMSRLVHWAVAARVLTLIIRQHHFRTNRNALTIAALDSSTAVSSPDR